MTMNPLSRSADLGKIVEPKAAPKPKPDGAPTEGASKPSGYAGHQKQYPTSAGRGDLLDSFSKFSKTLSAELAREERERRKTANEALGIDEQIETARKHKAQIASVVQSGEITEVRAIELWNNLHPDLKPEDVK